MTVLLLSINPVDQQWVLLSGQPENDLGLERIDDDVLNVFEVHYTFDLAFLGVDETDHEGVEDQRAFGPHAEESCNLRKELGGSFEWVILINWSSVVASVVLPDSCAISFFVLTL